MRTKLMVTALFGALVLLFTLSTAPLTGARIATPQYAPVPVFVSGDDKCATTTDDQIVDAIYKKMMDKYPGQSTHVNVRAKDGAVTVEGWASSEKIKNGIIKIAKKAKCVKSLDTNHLTVGQGGGCGTGYKDCGGTCIPQNEKCNTRG